MGLFWFVFFSGFAFYAYTHQDQIRRLYNEQIYEPWQRAFGDPGTPGQDPIILDLDGDGIETTGITDIDTCFDHDKNGFAELTTWAVEDDGVLAIAA